MTLEQYKNFCDLYFTEKQKEMTPQTQSQIKALSHEDYLLWSQEFNIKIDQDCREPIKNYISFIRAGYDPLKADESTPDPLQIPENKTMLQKYVATYETAFSSFLKTNSFIEEKNSEARKYILDKAEEASMHIQVEGKHFKAIKKIRVLWESWECDSTAWIVEDNSERKVVMTNHGQHYFAKKEDLESKIKEYKDIINETEEALSMLNDTTKKPKP